MPVLFLTGLTAPGLVKATVQYRRICSFGGGQNYGFLRKFRHLSQSGFRIRAPGIFAG